jgi:hypothetical protein
VREYVQAVIELYVSLPGTPARASRGDRRLARTLCERHVPVSLVRAALVLAVARRTLRSPAAAPLGPVRTLHYFLPVIEELTAIPVDPAYVEHLAARINTHLRRPSTLRLDSG